VVGVILVVAMLIIPGATAYLLTDRFSRMLVIAPVLSVFAAVTGIYLSYWLDASPGGLVVVLEGAVFAVVYVFAPRHGILGRRLFRTARRDGAGRAEVAGG
jgi:manganese transport system permease protein